LKKHGMDYVIPNYRLVRSYQELKLAMEELGYPERPVVVKPPASKGQRGFRILISSYRDFKEIYESKPTDPYINGEFFLNLYKHSGEGMELLVMEYLPGKEFTVDALCMDGKTLVIVPRERVKIAQGISVIAKIIKNDELIEVTKKINELFRFNYVINAQFKYGYDGKPKLLEINPRVAGTVCATIEAGANLPYLAIKLALGEDLDLPKIKWGTLFIRYWDHIVLDSPTN